jgi:hypothetical protein
MKTKILLCLLVTTANLTAQNRNETKTVFGNGTASMGYYLRPSATFGQIAGSTAVLPGVGAGVIINRCISIGLNYRFIATENTPAGEADTRLYLDQFYAGALGEYSLFPDKPVHLNIRLEAGLGHTELDLKDSYESESRGGAAGDASFGYLEPGLALEINLWKYLKLDIGAGYRLATEVVYRTVTEKNIRGFTGFAGLKAGIF